MPRNKGNFPALHGLRARIRPSNLIFVFYVFCWPTCCLGETAPYRTSQVLEIVKCSGPRANLSYANQQTLSLQPQPHPSLTLTLQTNISPPLNHPRPISSNQRPALEPQTFRNYPMLPILNCLPCPSLPFPQKPQ